MAKYLSPFKVPCYNRRMLIALLLGSSFGFISAVPVAGPVSAVIFTRGLRGKYAQGRWIAVGAAIVESLYAFLAFWGFSHFLADLTSVFTITNAVAAIMLGALGIYFYRSKKMRRPLSSKPHTNAHEPAALLLGAGLSAVNPSLIATWSFTVTTLYSMSLFPFTNANSISFCVGITIGIVGWFSLMMWLMARSRNSLNPKLIDRGLKVIGVALIALALWAAYRLITH